MIAYDALKNCKKVKEISLLNYSSFFDIVPLLEEI